MGKHGIAIIALIVSFCSLGLSLYLLNQQGQTQQLIQMMASQKTPQKGKRNNPDPYLEKQVKNAIVKNAGEIQACYKNYLDTKPEVKSGRVVLDWQIDENGSVINPSVVTNQMNNSIFNNCMTQKIGMIRFPFPPFGMNKYVEHTFLFKEDVPKEEDLPKPVNTPPK